MPHRRNEFRSGDSGTAQRAQRLTAHVAVRVAEQLVDHAQLEPLQSFQRPKRLDSVCGRVGDVAHNRFEPRGERNRLAIDNLLPRCMRLPQIIRSEIHEQFRAFHGGEVHHVRRRLVFVAHAPNASPRLIAIRMVARHLVVRNDFVVPVDDIQARVRPKVDRHRAKPFVRAADEIRQLHQREMRPIAQQLHRLHTLHHRVGDIKHIRVRIREPAVLVRERQPGQPRAAHAEPCQAREGWRVRFWKRRATRITRTHMKGHHRITIIVRFLDKNFSFAGEHQSPNVAGPVADRLKVSAVRCEPPHQRAIELESLARFRAHVRIVECALREQNPAARPARELVWQQMRIANPESGQDWLALVGASVAICVTHEQDVRPVLH